MIAFHGHALLVMVLLAGCVAEARSAPPHDPGPPTGVLAGTVTDLTGAPVKDADVYIELADLTKRANNIAAYRDGKNLTSVATDQDGRFHLKVASGRHSVAIRAAGFLPFNRTVDIPSPDNHRLDWTLAPRGTTMATAHRGASAYAPENTLSSIWKAFLLGADRHELDVALSQDRVPFLLHDNSLDRTSDCEGMSLEHTYAEIRRCDAGSWFDPSFKGEHVPTLREALELSKALGIFVVVEAKYDNDPAHRTMGESIAVANALGLGPRDALFMSFDHSFVAECAVTTAHACGQVLLSSDGRADIQETAETFLDVDEIHAPSGSVDAAYTSRVRGMGYRLTVWTVDNPSRMQQLIGWGVDSVTTNRPDLMLVALDAAARAAAGSQAE